jgi:hypothetical protein
MTYKGYDWATNIGDYTCQWEYAWQDPVTLDQKWLIFHMHIYQLVPSVIVDFYLDVIVDWIDPPCPVGMWSGYDYRHAGRVDCENLEQALTLFGDDRLSGGCISGSAVVSVSPTPP